MVTHFTINSLLPYMRDWTIQAGANGMNATDTLSRGAFMLGNGNSDALVGGTGSDLLVGNSGDDLLQGKGGNDFLLGGNGNDTYVYTTGDGFDTIFDRDGSGSIIMDGAVLSGGAQFGDELVHRDADGRLYVDVSPSTGSEQTRRMVIDGNILIESHAAGELGINMTGPIADVNPATTRDINGDLAPVDPVKLDDLNNLITDPNQPQPTPTESRRYPPRQQR